MTAVDVPAAAPAGASVANSGETASPTAGLFCAYCGKQFSRKEHLERHLPSHTNVKPYRCSYCQLSFSRRDLLVRHHTTYHEARDHNEPATGRPTSVTGRTPIACQNCATAKTGCDKRTPCSRCQEKGLPCEARYARRSGKTAARQAQARVEHQDQLVKSPPHDASSIDIAPGGSNTDQATSPRKASAMSVSDGLPAMASSHLNMTPASFPSPHQHLPSLDDFGATNGMVAFQDYAGSAGWTTDYGHVDYFTDLQIYDDMAVGHPDMMGLAEDPSDHSGASQLTPPDSYSGSEHTRDTSISPREMDLCALMTELDTNIPEFDEVKAAEDAWNLARCNPSIKMADCPPTSLVHLESLESMCKNEGSWSNLESYIKRADWDATDMASVEPLSPRTRETMLVITQTFLHKALDNHRENRRGRRPGSYAGLSRENSPPGDFTFIVLPPSKILEYFLRSYVRSLSLYYPLVVAGKVDPNEMMQATQTSTLLMLLMIAQGAAAIPVTEARYLSAGLAETCRISLTHIQSLELKKDPITLRCALLFIVLGVWSGDKWLMDYAMGQRSMYMDMVKDADMLSPQPAPSFDGPNSAGNKEVQWHDWVEREGQNRLVYNYVMLDQELCLFYDTEPRFAINQLECPLPSSEQLWLARNADEWLESVSDAKKNLSMQPIVAPSLRQLFDDFVSDTLGLREFNLSPQQLRLLLYPLQSLISNQRQLVRSLMNRPMPSSLQAAAEQQMAELEGLLAKWYILAGQQPTHDDECPVTRCNMALYHLISMNSAADFSEIEKLARRDKFDGAANELWLSQKRWFNSRVRTLYHAGRVLRWLRAMPRDRRPSWWSLAMYRATLVVWADSFLRADSHFQQTTSPANIGPNDGLMIPIDQDPSVDNNILFKCLEGMYGTPVLTLPNGLNVGLENPADVLSFGIKSIEDGSSTRLGDGIKRKLMKLAENWGHVHGPVPV